MVGFSLKATARKALSVVALSAFGIAQAAEPGEKCYPSVSPGPVIKPHEGGTIVPGVPSTPAAPTTPSAPRMPNADGTIPPAPGTTPSPMGGMGETPMTDPMAQTPQTPATQPTQDVSDQTTPNDQTSGEPEGAGLSAPYMFGDLLYTSRSVRFGFLRVNGTTNFVGLASTSIVNSNVAENNSPVPRDRVFLRYNFFRDAQAATGLSNQSIVQFAAPPGAGVPDARLQLPETKRYDAHFYTFGGEKTFFNRLMSVEVRVPIVQSLASKNTFSVGNITENLPTFDPIGNQEFVVQTTPGNTLGRYETEFGNITTILKGLLYQGDCNGLYISGGTAVIAPTQQNAQVKVIDFASTGGNPEASSQRLKDVTIENEIWTLSPFLAALYAPNERFFAQGFASVELPLNSSGINYSVRQLRGRFGNNPEALARGSLATPFAVQRDIDEQSLLHLDFNIGYWIYRSADCTNWLRGVATALEVHYTSTLEDADVVNLPGDASALMLDPNSPNIPRGVPEMGPIVGGVRSRMDIVDVTAGATFLLGDRAMLGTAFTVPVTDNQNKTFDWEFQVQLNMLFGNSATPSTPFTFN